MNLGFFFYVVGVQWESHKFGLNQKKNENGAYKFLSPALTAQPPAKVSKIENPQQEKKTKLYYSNFCLSSVNMCATRALAGVCEQFVL